MDEGGMNINGFNIVMAIIFGVLVIGFIIRHSMSRSPLVGYLN
jgi:hypothetical protein